jgi:hypothetical protein
MASDQDARAALGRERFSVSDQGLYTDFAKLASSLSLPVAELVTCYEVFAMEKWAPFSVAQPLHVHNPGMASARFMCLAGRAKAPLGPLPGKAPTPWLHCRGSSDGGTALRTITSKTLEDFRASMQQQQRGKENKIHSAGPKLWSNSTSWEE